MHTLLSVLADLLRFVLGREGSLSGTAVTSASAVPQDDRAAATAVHATAPVTAPQSASQPAPAAAKAAEVAADSAEQIESVGDVEYVCVPEAPLQNTPYLMFDGVLGHLTYGAPVRVVRPAGRFAEIRFGLQRGFLERDALTSEVGRVFPEFTSGREYLADDPETAQLRMYISDEFAAAPLAVPLQPGELVTYRLGRAGRSLPWGSDRPRLPGQWQQLLRGKRGISIGIMPRTGAVMEYRDEEGTGFLAYVESVTPEESLTLVAASADETGVFTRDLVPKEVWREWRPVFITTDVPGTYGTVQLSQPRMVLE